MTENRDAYFALIEDGGNEIARAKGPDAMLWYNYGNFRIYQDRLIHVGTRGRWGCYVQGECLSAGSWEGLKEIIDQKRREKK